MGLKVWSHRGWRALNRSLLQSRPLQFCLFPHRGGRGRGRLPRFVRICRCNRTRTTEALNPETVSIVRLVTNILFVSFSGLSPLFTFLISLLRISPPPPHPHPHPSTLSSPVCGSLTQAGCPSPLDVSAWSPGWWHRWTVGGTRGWCGSTAKPCASKSHGSTRRGTHLSTRMKTPYLR